MKEELGKSIDVVILGQRLPIASSPSHSPEYIKKIADYVDSKMKEIESKSGTASSLNVAIMAALNIADEYFILQDQQKNVLNKIVNKSQKLITYIDERLD